jgi:hypothetical protein
VIALGTTVAVIGIMTTTMTGVTLAATETAIEILIVLAGGIEILTVLDDGDQDFDRPRRRDRNQGDHVIHLH